MLAQDRSLNTGEGKAADPSSVRGKKRYLPTVQVRVCVCIVRALVNEHGLQEAQRNGRGASKLLATASLEISLIRCSDEQLNGFLFVKLHE